jgi:lysine 2,3-aminomutase
MSKTATLRTLRDLAAAGLIPPEKATALEAVAARYAVAIPRAFAALIDHADPHDPLARQFVPEVAELQIQPEEIADPIGDHTHSPVEGIVHRYPDRVLLKLTHTCAVYCRFCFRREMVGPGKPAALSREALARALAYIKEHPEIWEVILTGGDPLVLSPRRLREVMRALAEIKQVKVLRVHTRMPVADPAAITPDVVHALKVKGKPTYIAVHVNHARELTHAARGALARLADAGFPLVSQSVLLNGVNDTPETLEELLRALVEARVKPYYLHHADLAPSTAHLRTDIAAGRALMRELRGRVSGLCQPTYVLDIPGGHGKVPIGPCYLADENGLCRVEDPSGEEHVYPPQPRPGG